LNPDEKIRSLLVDGADGCCPEPRSEIFAGRSITLSERHGKLWIQGAFQNQNRRSEHGLCVARVETNWRDINARGFIESLPA
jgi:hypothetical protein